MLEIAWIRKSAAIALGLVLTCVGCGGEVWHPEFQVTSACSVTRDQIDWPPHSNIVAWHPDGSEVFFSVSGPATANTSANAPAAAIYRVSADGSQLRQIARTGPPDENGVGPATSFGLSPAGWHLVYASCAYATSSIHMEPPPGVRIEGAPPPSYRYDPELERVSAEGTHVKRLTEDDVVDGYPAWSPDGTRIAFLSDRVQREHRVGFEDLFLFTMRVDGSDVQALTSASAPAVAKHPPRWSPDGRRIAVVGDEGHREHGIYIFDADSGNWRRLTDAVSGPSWSPDGQRLAFAKPDGDDVALYTVAADGTDAQRVVTVTGWRPHYGAFGPTQAWIGIVAWSPDGSKILYSCGGICVADLNDAEAATQATPAANTSSAEDDVHPLPSNDAKGHPRRLPGSVAAWSPDGSRIVTVIAGPRDPNRRGEPIVLTMAPDGSDVRVLVREHEEDGLQAMGPRPSADPVDMAGCGAGTAVPRPDANPGLVQDCETLLVVQAKLAGVGGLGWTTERPLKEWDGVFLGDPRLGVYRPPLRVRRLLLGSRGLRGEIPPELAQLTQLSRLVLSGNQLAGKIPPALAELTELEFLDLSENYLSGAIPAEFGALTKLEVLRLSGNYLWMVPPDPARVTELRGSSLGRNALTSCIPPGPRIADRGSLGLSDCGAA